MVFHTERFQLKPLVGLSLLLFIALGATSVLASRPPNPTPAVWQVNGQRGTAYLLTALNIGNDDFYPLQPEIEALFAASDNLVVSVDLTKIDPEELNASILAAALYPEGQTITDWLSPAEIQRCEETLTRYGLALNQLAPFRPWFLMVTIEAVHQQTMGYFPDQSLDVYFLNKAGGKKIIGLESPVEQATLLAQFPPATEKLLLLEALNSDLTKETEELVTAWWTGDLEQLEALIFAPQNKEPAYLDYYEKIYFTRNRRMVEKIEELLTTDETYFLLLPCGHFLGDKGIIALLQGKGFTVERLAIPD